MRLSRRGTVMVHVLVTAVVTSVIAAGLLRMLLLRYQATARAQDSVVQRRRAEGSFMYLVSAWNANAGQVCNSVPGSGYTCTGTPGTCGCTCTATAAPAQIGDAKVVTCVVGARCAVRACSDPSVACSCP